MKRAEREERLRAIDCGEYGSVDRAVVALLREVRCEDDVPSNAELRRLEEVARQRDLKPENGDDTPETIEAAARAYDVLSPHLGNNHLAGILATAGYPWAPSLTKMTDESRADFLSACDERDALRAEVERLTKATVDAVSDPTDDELIHAYDVGSNAGKAFSVVGGLRAVRALHPAPAPCTHADLLGPVTEEERHVAEDAYAFLHREMRARDASKDAHEPCIEKAVNAVFASRRAKAGAK